METPSCGEQPTTATRTADPRRWKMWVLLTCAIYPLILLSTLITTFLNALPPVARLLVLVPLMTASMVWGVLPQIQRRFGGWLTS